MLDVKQRVKKGERNARLDAPPRRDRMGGGREFDEIPRRS